MSGRLSIGCVAWVLSVFFLACGSPRVVLRLQTEMAGAHCASGGVAVQTGTDVNSNQALDDAEVFAEQTRYICNGASGPAGDAGAPGVNALSMVTAEPAGTNCRSGGVRVDVGLDADADGTLSTAEISSTHYVCNGATSDSVYFGDVTLRNTADLALLDGIQTLAGNLFVVSGSAGVVTLPQLRVVAGQIHLFSGEGDPYQGEFPTLTAVSFPELTRAGGLDAVYTDTLATLSAPKLERLNSLNLAYNPELTTLTLGKLAFVDDFTVRSNDRLPALALPELQVAQALQVSSNPMLASLSAARLAEVRDSLEVFNNPLLSACSGYSMLAHLTVQPRFANVGGNDETPTCTGAQVCATRTLAGLSNPLARCLRPLNFTAAQATCASLGTGAALAWVTSDAEWLALSAAVSAGTFSGAGWLGYSDAATEGTWVAVGGFTGYSPTSRIDFWAPGQPSDTTSTANAVQLYDNGLADDADASLELPFTCRVP